MDDEAIKAYEKGLNTCPNDKDLNLIQEEFESLKIKIQSGTEIKKYEFDTLSKNQKTILDKAVSNYHKTISKPNQIIEEISGNDGDCSQIYYSFKIKEFNDIENLDRNKKQDVHKILIGFQ